MKKYPYLLASFAIFLATSCESVSSGNISYPPNMPPFERFESRTLSRVCGAPVIGTSYSIRGVSERWVAWYVKGAKYPTK